jgi:hypothetical protein
MMREWGAAANVHWHAGVHPPGRFELAGSYARTVNEERKHTMWNQCSGWAICIEGVDEQRETDYEANGDMEKYQST